MHKKPTSPFGHIAFGKDGSVRKHMEELSPSKVEQEQRVALLFAEEFSLVTNRHYKVNPCEENDHDFWLESEAGRIIVQATKVVSRE